MYRILIVDDEPFTVDGLYEMLLDELDMDLDIYRAYSAAEAMGWLTRTKMDIVLSDIRMPEMDGLQLQQWIQSRWPRCKVIFLTGVNDIQSAQQAQRSGGVDYILKTEGDEAIVQSIRRATSAIQEDLHNEDLLIRAKGQLKELLPMLRREWFTAIMEQGGLTTANLSERLRELDTILRAEEAVMLVCGRVDYWDERYSMSDQSLLLYAIQNIAEEYLDRVVMLPVMLSGSYFVWLLQPKLDGETQWDELPAYIQGTLESIQQTCRALLHIPVSFISYGSQAAWEDIVRIFHLLKQSLILGLGNGQEMILLYRGEENATPASEAPALVIPRIESAVEMGQKPLFVELLNELFRGLPNRFAVYAQTYYAVAVILLKQWNHMNRNDYGDDADAETTIRRLLDVNAHKTKEQAVQFLSEMGCHLIRHGKQEQDERTERMINKLNRYIVEHLDKDLSLAFLADVVYLNPSYLSNLYKTYTGRNISDYITELRVERAKALLAESQAKVQEVAVAVGFDTAGYFTRFFKKHVGVTPQEFRSRI
ncbi:response regulator transcription factor [Paenibacillus mucilaginosus]|uniref:YbbB n=1 Tax=Paenibacillus mucilaginosus (strain KNP414) TaxID=1036673 RepID=F8FQP6_PAEMK|nr:response regulator [Paenibacillus mucilaginosus]AEI40401.1 YbbB [Paenibacillus mucilaginosus KNP414]MCG7213251.1 response regulator [Paenibacillus mucilaginosus]WDM29587.1 response regulator [Paenibacillus mucilaginosus]